MEYNKVQQSINDVVGDNVKKLAQLFPSAVKDGEVDFDALKEELGQFKEVDSEKYELTWAGKKNAKKIAQEDIIGKTLKYIPEDSKDAENTENLYIEGDNLEVLKLLRQNYYGAIKMIYIDPPYNTGNDFVYNDKCIATKADSDIAEGEQSEEGERYVINTKSQNRYHAKWLNNMYSRLKVAKDLLSDNGVIYISIDDNEIDNLKKLCNEIFDENNFIACIIWIKKYGIQNDAKFYSNSHDYILMYAKNKEMYNQNLLPRTEQQDSRYKNPDNDPRGPWKPADFSVPHHSSDRVYEIELPSGRKVKPSQGRSWGASEDGFRELVNDNRIYFGTKNDSVPSLKKFLSEVKGGVTATTVWNYDEVGHTDKAKKSLDSLFDGKTVFDYPKPVDLIKKIVTLSSDKDSTILDFFSGSATIAQAVMEKNIEDGGNRKYIAIQYPELVNLKSVAYSNGYTNICEIGKERIRRAGERIKDDNPDTDIDTGFKVFRVADTNIKWNSYIGAGQLDLSQIESTPDLVDFIPNAKDVDIVYELMLRQKDVPLSSKIEQIFGGGYSRTYLYADSYLVCLETKITEELVDKLAGIDPLPIKFIFRDSAFQDDIALKDETFRRLKALIERNNGMNKMTYTVEFI